MKIAVASSRGVTGKTTVGTNVAHVASLEDKTVACIDCDVDEPNGHLFLKPEIRLRNPAVWLILQVDPDKCALCGRRRRYRCGIKSNGVNLPQDLRTETHDKEDARKETDNT
jgi:MinD superfamily P-loop ATPase